MTKLLRITSLLVCVALLPVAFIGCRGGSNDVPKKGTPKVTIGIQVSPAMALVMVAKDKGFFEQQGVDVEIKEFTAGKFALQAFLSGGIDFAVSGEVPAGLATLQGNDIRVVAQVVERTVNEVRVVALKDGDLNDPSSYFKAKRRKIATSFGGGPEFFTYNFLNEHDIADDVEILSQKPADMPAALESESLDAIAIFDPFAFVAEKRLADKVITFADEDLYSELYVLDALPQQIEDNPEVIQAIVTALVKAGDYIAQNPEEAKAITLKYTKLEPDVLDGIWGNFVFKPALTAQLVEYWEAQAQWAIDTDKVNANTPFPDYRSIIDDRFLMKSKPDAVQLPVLEAVQ
ncbi:MAG: ABC transporter substrate-binding protein [Planctomycetota bacterium]